MSIQPSRIDSILQYTLLVAGEEDEPFDRQLGPIHLIKYVYLADLFYAKRHQGETYTGTNWQFYNFGPWSPTVFERLEPALSVIHAEKRIIESKYENKDEWVRWSHRDEYLLETKDRELPSEITIHLRKHIHNFGSDTPGLLDFVYKTWPMLSAAPNEYLDFSPSMEDSIKTSNESLKMDELSNNKKKKFSEKMQMLRESYKNKRTSEGTLVNPASKARYDDVFDEGIDWLESLAGPELDPGEKIVNFSDDVWKSTTRKGEDVS